MTRPFAFVPLPGARTGKPRARGLTMLADMGYPIERVEAALRLTGGFIDVAKFFAGSARLYDEDYLRDKLDLYRSHDIGTFTGGAFLEHALAVGGASCAPRFLDELVRLGFSAIEISDQTTVLTEKQRIGVIEEAIARGLDVFAELGSKAASVTPVTMVKQAKAALASGARMVTVEAGELLKDGVRNDALIAAIQASLDLDRVLFEIPSPGVIGMTTARALDLKRFLIRTFGPDVSLGNIRIDDIFDTEVRRAELGPSVALTDGVAQVHLDD